MKKFIMAIAVGSLALTGIACGGGSACQAAADSAGACGEAYMTANDIEMPEAAEGAEEAAACVDNEATDAMYDCMAAAYDGADCSTMDGMMAAGTLAAACAEATTEEETTEEETTEEETTEEEAAE